MKISYFKIKKLKGWCLSKLPYSEAKQIQPRFMRISMFEAENLKGWNLPKLHLSEVKQI